MEKIEALFESFAEALIIYGLIIVGYGILVIHITKTWYGDWPVDRNLPGWFTLDTFMMVSFALSFFGFITWRYLKYTEPIAEQTCAYPLTLMEWSLWLRMRRLRRFK